MAELSWKPFTKKKKKDDRVGHKYLILPGEGLRILGRKLDASSHDDPDGK